LLNLLPLISSQSELSNVTPVLCIGSPCLYKGECRDKFGECGVTVSHCDAESQWVPACGGGGDLDQPTAIEPTATVVTIAPLATSSSEPIESSQVEQCIGSPCIYKGECRDKNGECGETVSHCDAESQWVPACGGGGGLDKPTAIEPTATVVTIAPLATSSSEPIEPSQVEQPTFSPITAWEEWNSDQAVPGLTTGQDGGSDAPSNGTATDWFDPDEWDDGKNQTADNEDVSMLDKIEETVFGSGAMAEGASFLLRMLAVLAWVAVL
jgi:hypothetical protein